MNWESLNKFAAFFVAVGFISFVAIVLEKQAFVWLGTKTGAQSVAETARNA